MSRNVITGFVQQQSVKLCSGDMRHTHLLLQPLHQIIDLSAHYRQSTSIAQANMQASKQTNAQRRI
jgi:hypothetical protein